LTFAKVAFVISFVDSPENPRENGDVPDDLFLVDADVFISSVHPYNGFLHACNGWRYFFLWRIKVDGRGQPAEYVMGKFPNRGMKKTGPRGTTRRN
jgi:hypothetical protein